ncbi:Hemocyte protein-glutamine gamma-glutamyltransferase [Nymphon striatum]|nr:Hemocyte protein-glutamine gamma-glutamyltransferase [Nymphon striatum]
MLVRVFGPTTPFKPTSQQKMSRRTTADQGRSTGTRWDDYDSYMSDLMAGMRLTYESRRGDETTGVVASVDGGRSGRDVVVVASDADFEKRPLVVETVDFYVDQNSKEHHTNMFELVDGPDPLPVFRRGQTIVFSIKFSRRIYEQLDVVKLCFLFGQKPLARKGTSVDLPIHFGQRKFSRKHGKWDVRVNEISRDILTLQVMIPATVGVGEWRLQINTALGLHGMVQKFECGQHIYLLFNPWCKDDAVFMDKESMRKEYVLNDIGKVYVGSYKKPRGRRWVFGQYDDAVLPACMYLLGLAKLDYTARANPVKVVRVISAVVNAQDDNGVLVGNWSGEYDDGTAPWAWTGSAAILEEYLQNGGVPVKYGQCWVFSGVTTTICRALGIPCRSVTNFVSAHDTDETITIDKYFNADGDELNDSGDSIWLVHILKSNDTNIENFHVWNDCWMSRPDLPPGYGGWQAIDATPQEASDGMYRAGPASLIAIRRGQIGFLYDTPFLFSEVNADIMHWQEDPQNEIGWKKLKSNKYHVGRCILTKKCDVDDDEGEADQDNILTEYKNKEGAEDCPFLFDMPTTGHEDVYFDLVDIDTIMIGQAFHIRVKVKNRSRERRTITMVLTASTLYYTGVRANKIRREKHAFVLSAGQEESFRLTIRADEYLDKLVDHAMMKIYAIATVQETKQTWAEEDDFAVEKPKPVIKVRGVARVGRSFEIEVKFTNPLKTRLERSEFTFEGPGLSKRRSVRIREVRPEETIVHYERFIPRQEGMKKIVVGFNSKQLSDMIASRQVEVVCELLDIHEIDYFGLQYSIRRDENLWLNMRNPIREQLGLPSPFRLKLRFKFPVEPHLLLQDTTRYQLYLNIKEDLYYGKIRVKYEDAVEIAALFNQSEHGDFDNMHSWSANLSTYHHKCLLNLQNDGNKYNLRNDQKGMSCTAAQLAVLKSVSVLEGFGVEYFSVRIDQNEFIKVGVRPQGLYLCDPDTSESFCSIPFTVITVATQKEKHVLLTYLVNNGEESKSQSFKLDSVRSAAALYRAIIEKHAFYSCETVRNCVTTQYIRDLKGTIASLFNEKTPLGKNYVFDVRHTFREVYDNTKRYIYKMELEAHHSEVSDDGEMVDSPESHCSNISCKVMKEKLYKLEDSLLCCICRDTDISTAFFPCRHVITCSQCAEVCDFCPVCRSTIEQKQHIYLPMVGHQDQSHI